MERGDRVRVLDDMSSGRPQNLAHLEVGGPESGAPVELLEGDVADPATARRACSGAMGAFHEAAQVSVPASFEDPERSYRTNVMGTLAVLEGARREGLEGVVFAASSAAYGDDPSLPKEESMRTAPLSPYASGKLAAEELLRVWGRSYGLRTVCLRYFNVFGPRQADDSPYTGVIAIFARALLDGAPVRIHGDGGQTRDFVYVQDAVRANLLAMDARRLDPGEVLNVGTGERVSIGGLYAELRELAGRSEEPEYGPERGGRRAAQPGVAREGAGAAGIPPRGRVARRARADLGVVSLPGGSGLAPNTRLSSRRAAALPRAAGRPSGPRWSRGARSACGRSRARDT